MIQSPLSPSGLIHFSSKANTKTITAASLKYSLNMLS